MGRVRTNIEIESLYLERIMDRYGVHTKTEAVDLALRHLAGDPMSREEALAMRGARALCKIPDDVAPDDACEWGVRRITEGIRNDLARIGVHFDTWFSERTLHERDEISDVLRVLDAKGVMYEQDGARWLRTTDFGDSRDRVRFAVVDRFQFRQFLQIAFDQIAKLPQQLAAFGGRDRAPAERGRGGPQRAR